MLDKQTLVSGRVFGRSSCINPRLVLVSFEDARRRREIS